MQVSMQTHKALQDRVYKLERENRKLRVIVRAMEKLIEKYDVR